MSSKDLDETITLLLDRVTELESREAFHDYTLEALNQTIIQQQEMIERLTRVAQQLISKVKEMPANEDKNWSLDEEVPPHY